MNLIDRLCSSSHLIPRRDEAVCLFLIKFRLFCGSSAASSTSHFTLLSCACCVCKYYERFILSRIFLFGFGLHFDPWWWFLLRLSSEKKGERVWKSFEQTVFRLRFSLEIFIVNASSSKNFVLKFICFRNFIACKHFIRKFFAQIFVRVEKLFFLKKIDGQKIYEINANVRLNFNPTKKNQKHLHSKSNKLQIHSLVFAIVSNNNKSKKWKQEHTAAQKNSFPV